MRDKFDRRIVPFIIASLVLLITGITLDIVGYHLLFGVFFGLAVAVLIAMLFVFIKEFF